MIERRSECGIISLHISDLADAARFVARRYHAVAPGNRQRKGLFAQNMEPRRECGDGKIGMKGVGKGNDDRIEIAAEKVVETAAKFGDAIAVSQRGQHCLRRFDQGDEFKPRLVFPQKKSMLRLTHKASTA